MRKEKKYTWVWLTASVLYCSILYFCSLENIPVSKGMSKQDVDYRLGNGSKSGGVMGMSENGLVQLIEGENIFLYRLNSPIGLLYVSFDDDRVESWYLQRLDN